MSDTNTGPGSASGRDYVEVLDSAELALGEQRTVTVRTRRVLVCRTATGVHALFDVCPHARQSLTGGTIAGNAIECPRHGACFDLDSGRPVNGVTNQPLKLLDVREANGRIAVKLPPPSAGYLAWKKPEH